MEGKGTLSMPDISLMNQMAIVALLTGIVSLVIGVVARSIKLAMGCSIIGIVLIIGVGLLVLLGVL
jgi:hypothetical protein